MVSAIAPPLPPQPPPYTQRSQAGTSALPPGWAYGVIMDDNGDRRIVPVPPGEVPPAPTSVTDPVQRARGRLEMLSFALEAYYAGALNGFHQYPRAGSLSELTRDLQRVELLPQGWTAAAQVSKFVLGPYRYQIALTVDGQRLETESPLRPSPYSPLWFWPRWMVPPPKTTSPS